MRTLLVALCLLCGCSGPDLVATVRYPSGEFVEFYGEADIGMITSAGVLRMTKIRPPVRAF